MNSVFKYNKQAIVTSIGLLAASVVNANPSGFSTTTPGDVLLNGDSLEFRQDGAVANFDSFSIGATETFNVVPGGTCDSSCRGIARVTGGAQSMLEGDLNLGLNFFLINPNGVLMGQDFKLNLESVTSDFGSGFVVTTYDFDAQELANSGNIVFNRGGASGNIVVNGLEAVGDNGQVLLLSHDVDINGNVIVPAGTFSALAAEGATVYFESNNLMQFDITSALASAPSDGAISIGPNAQVTAGEINLSAFVDPLAFAVNNEGVLEANGIDTAGGAIRLVGAGGALVNDGTLDVSNGQTESGLISLSATTVELDGVTNAGTDGQVEVEIGLGSPGQNNANVIGGLSVGQNAEIFALEMSVTGFGVINQISGLANYHVSGANSGSAAFRNVGSSNWDNNGSIVYNNVSVLFGRPTLAQEFVIFETGSLGTDFQGQRVGQISGGALNDTFIIEGSVESLFGEGGNDTFQMVGDGQILTEVQGGSDIDSLIDVVDPQLFGLGTGSGDNVVLWTSVENISEFVDSVDSPANDPAVNDIVAPQLTFANLSGQANATLGLIGDGELRLPCGFNTQYEDPADAFL